MPAKCLRQPYIYGRWLHTKLFQVLRKWSRFHISKYFFFVRLLVKQFRFSVGLTKTHISQSNFLVWWEAKQIPQTKRRQSQSVALLRLFLMFVVFPKYAKQVKVK